MFCQHRLSYKILTFRKRFVGFCLFFVYSNVSYERGDRFGPPFDWDAAEAGAG
jgi:hypothetical protein